MQGFFRQLMGDLWVMALMFVVLLLLVTPVFLLWLVSPEYAIYLVEVMVSIHPEITLWHNTSLGFIFNWYAFPFYVAFLVLAVKLVWGFFKNVLAFLQYIGSGRFKELFDPQAMYEKHQEKIKSNRK